MRYAASALKGSALFLQFLQMLKLSFTDAILKHDFTLTTKEQGWHSWLVRGLGARGPEFDSRISHPCFDFFPFRVAK